LFVHTDKEVTAKLFLPVFSPPGSNTREKKEAIILNWKNYIFEVQGL